MRFSGLIGAAMMAVMAAWPARAEDVALLIGNADYSRQPDMPEAARITDAAVALTRADWSVITFRNLPSDAADPVLRRLADRLEDADRVVVFLAGRFAHGAGDAWLLAADADRPGMIGVSRAGVSLGALLVLAGQKPGGAVVLLGDAPADLSLGAGLSAGPGGLVPPQGVLLAEGPVAELDRLLRERLLRPGTSYATALRGAGPDVRVSGFTSALTGLVTGAPDPDPEAGYWRAVADIDTPAAYERYLDRFPDGANAAEARARLGIGAAPPAAPGPEEVEAALGLDRAARRSVQRGLSLLGHDPRGVDGIFGGGTRAALAAWQRANGYPASGYLDAAQYRQLSQQAAARTAQLEEEARQRRLAEERADRAYWARTGAGGSAAGLRDYLDRYPDGLHADAARAALERIEAEAQAAARAEERRIWDLARRRDTVPAYAAYLDRYPDGRFARFARIRIAELRGRPGDGRPGDDRPGDGRPGGDRPGDGRPGDGRPGDDRPGDDRPGGDRPGGDRPDDSAWQQREQALGLTPFTRRMVEGRLQALGLEPGLVDGEFDRATRRALRRYQRDNGLVVTGYLDQPTVARLLTGALLPRAQ